MARENSCIAALLHDDQMNEPCRGSRGQSGTPSGFGRVASTLFMMPLLPLGLPAGTRVRTFSIIARLLPPPASTLPQPAPSIGDFPQSTTPCLLQAHANAAAGAWLASRGFAPCASDQRAHRDRNEHQHRKSHFTRLHRMGPPQFPLLIQRATPAEKDIGRHRSAGNRTAGALFPPSSRCRGRCRIRDLPAAVVEAWSHGAIPRRVAFAATWLDKGRAYRRR